MPFPRALILASAAAAFLASAAPAHAQTLAGRAIVVDGDTLEIRGTRVRLFGIAQVADDHICTRTDDERWKCGPRALNALEEFLEESIVTCAVKERDAAGQAIGVCTAGGTDVSLWLVRNGLAMVPPAMPKGRYRQAQDVAKAAHAGLWSTRE